MQDEEQVWADTIKYDRDRLDAYRQVLTDLIFG